MTTSIIYSGSPGGTPYSLPESMGILSPGEQSSEVDVYISHDGAVAITNCAFYILPYSAGVYLGANSAQNDYDLIIGWGDASYPATSGGGLYVNMNHSASFPSSSWEVFYTGYGDSLANAISLPVTAISSGTAVAGQIAAGGEAHIRWRIDIPASHTDTGIGYIDNLMYYSSSS